jgi:hypothetical protein
MRAYVTHALECLQDKGHAAVTLKALGRAITKAVIIGGAGGAGGERWGGGLVAGHTGAGQGFRKKPK